MRKLQYTFLLITCGHVAEIYSQGCLAMRVIDINLDVEGSPTLFSTPALYFSANFFITNFVNKPLEVGVFLHFHELVFE